jgi:hypothetical protein
MKIQFKQLALASGILLTVTTSAFADPMLSTGGYARQLQNMEMMKMIDSNGDHMVTSNEFMDYYGAI